jgi:hypothetical protein
MAALRARRGGVARGAGQGRGRAGPGPPGAPGLRGHVSAAAIGIAPEVGTTSTLHPPQHPSSLCRVSASFRPPPLLPPPAGCT